MFKSPTPTIPPLTKFKINFIPNLLSYDHFRMITVWIILYDRTVWSYDTVPWHRTLYYYDSIPSLLYYIDHLPVFLSVKFSFPVLVFVNLHMMSFQIFYSSWLLDWFQMLPFYFRQESIAKIIWTTWICDEIFFGEIKWNESKNIIL